MTVTHTDTIIVGAGFAGIGLGAQLRRAGHTNFVVLERAEDLGGTWRDNTYPGIACDVPSHVYSYSFRPSPSWSRWFAEGQEIHRYLRWVADEEGVTGHIRFGADVRAMWWDEADALWRLSTARGDYAARVLVLAAGRLSEPKLPPVPGLHLFAAGSDRAAMHSARWNHEVPLEGRRIAIVGSGASAIQLVPELAAVASQLTVLQRSAPYVVPKRDREIPLAERTMFARVPEAMHRVRDGWFWQQERVFAQRALVGSEAEAARRAALAYLESEIADPALRTRLTPRYEIGCKRVLLSDTYYRAFTRPNVRLIDSPLDSLEAGTLIARDGRRAEADVAVFATGFQSAQQPYAQRVFGVGGVKLSDEWADGMHGFASIAVPRFPNLFVMNGPNAGLGHNSAIVMLETQIGYIVQALDHLTATGAEALEVRRDRADAYAAMIADMSADTVWMRGGCESWYRDPRNGKLTLLWPGTTMSFRDVAGVFDPRDYASVPPRSQDSAGEPGRSAPAAQLVS